jgi:hypothetical protein
MVGPHCYALHEIVFLNLVISAVLLAFVDDRSSDICFCDSS